MKTNLDKRFAVWINTYRDNRFIYDELTARAADKWIDDYPDDKMKLEEIRDNLRKNLILSSGYLREIFGVMKEQFEQETKNAASNTD
ncbi:MAG: hypothetical protein IJP96_10280 [Synergistaceae bacterium]|nr:hypothetical protein [Synergistaceae bacterium]MBQ6738610.1 hypothetical protein [Synergistaceae bacterium]MBR0076130.1 hypothetical protein [Synergistaceae bacterium]MBR0080076.1 hypothetical protein [Synergistaceae bacterium]MBR0233991.1 hypothetical protein [Synergistaceae bacterium]